MNYELAKQLKDAGYPISLLSKGCENCWGDLHQGCTSDCETIELPSLSQLIEACGDEFGGLYFMNKVGEEYQAHAERFWIAESYRAALIASRDLQYYATPEEAVVRLWLSLKQS